MGYAEPLIHATSGGDPSVLRRLNLSTILRVLHAGGVHTISGLAAISGLSRPTTKQAVDDLLSSGWVVLADSAEPAMGRPAAHYIFRPDAALALGIDLGAHKILVILTDLSGRELARSRRAVLPEMAPERRLAVMAEAIDEVFASSGCSADRIYMATVATVGSVDASGKVIYCKAIEGWEGQNPAAWLQQRFGFETIGASDMPMSALAEHWRGAAQASRDVVYLHAGRRLGAACLIGGRPHVGHHSAAAQIGMWRGLTWKFDYDDLLHLAEDPSGSEVAAKRVFEAAARGDPQAKERIEEFAADVVQGLAPIIITVDPELLVIGGGVSAAGAAIAEPVRRRLQLETDFPPEVVCSMLGDESVALGAIRTALDLAETKLFAKLMQSS